MAPRPPIGGRGSKLQYGGPRPRVSRCDPRFFAANLAQYDPAVVEDAAYAATVEPP
jgi:hypothetical protein